MVLMSFGGPNNSVVRDFIGGVRAASYWIGNRLLSASDITNDSSVTGATVKAALNTLSSTSSAVFPFTAAGLAEKDLVSYDASAATWKNRTVAAALSGQVTSTMVSNSSTVPGSLVTTALQEIRPNSVTYLHANYLSRPLVFKAGQTVTASAGNFILDNSDNFNSIVCTPSAVVSRDTIVTRVFQVTPASVVSVVGTANASVTVLSANKWRITRLTTANAALVNITLSAAALVTFDIEGVMTAPQTIQVAGYGISNSVTGPLNPRVFGRLVNASSTPTVTATAGTGTIGDYWDLTIIGCGTADTGTFNYDTTFTIS